MPFADRPLPRPEPSREEMEKASRALKEALGYLERARGILDPDNRHGRGEKYELPEKYTQALNVIQGAGACTTAAIDYLRGE